MWLTQRAWAATIHRLLSGLVARGFVDQDKQNNRYFIGLKMISRLDAAVASLRREARRVGDRRGRAQRALREG